LERVELKNEILTDPYFKEWILGEAGGYRWKEQDYWKPCITIKATKDQTLVAIVLSS
jgi:hypothetical protein